MVQIGAGCLMLYWIACGTNKACSLYASVMLVRFVIRMGFYYEQPPPPPLNIMVYVWNCGGRGWGWAILRELRGFLESADRGAF